jgi:ribose/xylose/arabinose/galactoside ABC-type transport system permease subunit
MIFNAFLCAVIGLLVGCLIGTTMFPTMIGTWGIIGTIVGAALFFIDQVQGEAQ